MAHNGFSKYLGEVVQIEWVDPCVDVVGATIPEGGAACAHGIDVGRVHSIKDDIMVLTTRQLAGPGGGQPHKQQYAAVPIDSIWRITPYKPGKPVEV